MHHRHGAGRSAAPRRGAPTVTRAVAALAITAGAAVVANRCSFRGFSVTGSGAGAPAFIPAVALHAASPPPAASGLGALGDLPQLTIAAEEKDMFQELTGLPFISDNNSFDAGTSGGPDLFFYFYLITSAIIVIVSLYLVSRGYWENRWMVEKINAQKLKFITNESATTPQDRYELARMYSVIRDYPAALAEYDEVEESWNEMRDKFDPEDTMGALASRAMLHNSKGYSLTNLEPARPAAARREFVRAITFWPEYPEALLNIGQELIKRSRYDVAVRTLNSALKWQPGSEPLKEAHQKATKGLEEAEMMREQGFVN